MISETKTGSSLCSSQFHLEGYPKTCRSNRNANESDILILIREDIPSTFLISNLSIEGSFVEINLWKKVCLLCCCRNPKKNVIVNYSNFISRSPNLQLIYYYGWFQCTSKRCHYENFLSDLLFQKYCQRKDLFQKSNKSNLHWLDRTDRPISFQESEVVETALTDFQTMKLTVIMVFWSKQKPKVVCYIKY